MKEGGKRSDLPMDKRDENRYLGLILLSTQLLSE